jgi:hypothetical protein
MRDGGGKAVHFRALTLVNVSFILICLGFPCSVSLAAGVATAYKTPLTFQSHHFVSSPASSSSREPSLKWVKRHAIGRNWYLAFVNAISLPNNENRLFLKWAIVNLKTLPAAMVLEIGNKLYESDQQNALRWHVLGQLRLKKNLTLCKNQKDVWQGKIVLDKIAEQLINYRMFNPKKSLSATKSSLKWDKQYPDKTSPSWDCLIATNLYRAALRKPPEKEPPQLISAINHKKSNKAVRTEFHKLQKKWSSMHFSSQFIEVTCKKAKVKNEICATE